MYITKREMLEIAIEYIDKMASDEDENSILSISGYSIEDCKKSEKESLSLRFASNILRAKLRTINQKLKVKG